MMGNDDRRVALRGCAGTSVAVWAVALFGTAVHAQPAGPGGINFWLNPANGSWYDSLAWGGVIPSQGGVPDSLTTASLPGVTAYRVDVLGGTAQCHHLSLGNAQATLRVAGIGAGNATTLVLNGTQWDSHGTVLVGGPDIGSTTVLRINNNITIGGSGTLRLDAQNLPQTVSVSPTFNQGWLLINGAQHTISGEGMIDVRLQNEGTIRADIPSRALTFQSSFLTTNNALISATNGASIVLNTNGGVTQSGGGSFFAGPGSQLTILNVGTPGLTGGSITTQGTGRLLIATQGAKINDVTLTGGSLMTILGNSGVFIGPSGLRNFGTINTGPAGFVASEFGGSATVSGTGRLQMEGGSLSSLFGGGGYALINAVDHTIGGHGVINLTLTNFGTVLADRNGQSTGPTDVVLQQGTKFNSGSMVARNGGLLRLQQNVTVDQTTFGILHAEQASAVLIENATVIGGRLASSGSGVVSVSGASSIIDGVRIAAGSRAVVTCGSTLLARNAINIDGTLELNSQGCGPNSARLNLDTGASLLGAGVVRLLPAAQGSNVTIASQGSAQLPALLAPGLTVSGQGRLSGSIDSRATLSPDRAHLSVNQGGGPIGTIELAPGGGRFEQQQTGVVEIELASLSDHDRLASSGHVELGGLLRARLINGFTPSLGQTFTVMTCQPCSGVFDTVDIPAGFRVVYSASSVVLDNNPCGPADIGGQGGVATPDGALDNNDFVVFIDWFFSGDTRADVGVQGGVPGADGAFDNNDFIVFIDQFFSAC